MMMNAVLECIRRRRVTRFFTDDLVPHETLTAVLDAARWAPTAGNNRVHRFVPVIDRLGIELIRTVSPGMLGHPATLIVICIDWEKADQGTSGRQHHAQYIDVGTAAENMLIAAEALDLGAGPVTSFSREAVREILGLPQTMQPELIVCLGKRAPGQPSHGTRPPRRTRLTDLVVRRRFAPLGGA
jgi:nitroreductase